MSALKSEWSGPCLTLTPNISPSLSYISLIGKEIPILSLRLRIQLEPYGIKLNQNKFEAMIEEDNDISTVMKFCGNLLFQEDDSESDHDEDEFSVESGLTFEFEEFCKKIEEKAPKRGKKKASIMDIVTVGEKYAQGSVEVAQAGEATLLTTKNKKEERRKVILKEVKKRQVKLSKKQASLGLSPGTLDAHLDESGRSGGGLRMVRSTSQETLIIGNVVIRVTSGEF